MEKGDGKDGKEGKEGESSHTRKLSTAEENTAVKGRAGKWGRLLGKPKKKLLPNMYSSFHSVSNLF